MRVMLDTNVLLSALLFPGQKFDLLLGNIFSCHELVLSNFIVDELRKVVLRKFPQKIEALERFIAAVSFEFVIVPEKYEQTVSIRDPNDYPVVLGAFVGCVDVLVTGDKDFTDLNISKPEILTPSAYVDKYVLRIG